MEKYTFIVRKSDQSFASIVKHLGNDLSHIGLNLELYSALTTDENTARLNFTATGHLPSEIFEEMINAAKEVV